MKNCLLLLLSRNPLMDAVSVGLGVGFYLFKCEASTYFIESQKNLSLEDL